MKLKLIYFTLLFICASYTSKAFVECDDNIFCIGNALILSQSSGLSAQFVNIESNGALQSISRTMSVQVWIKAKRQQGKVQYIGGLWGPAEDDNDVWVLYINENDSLIFEISHPGFSLGSLDNTQAKADFSGNYDSWHHVTAVFNGFTGFVSLYLNGELVDTYRNNEFAPDRLNVPQNPGLNTLVGSTNAFSNDPELNRTFLGEMDEFRIWSRVLSPDEIACNLHKSLNGDGADANLELYFRFNEEADAGIICDASGRDNFGELLSGASCAPPDTNREIPKTVVFESLDLQPPYRDTLVCDSVRKWRFSIRDTGECTKSFFMFMRGENPGDYSITPNRISDAVKDSTYIFELEYNGTHKGTLNSQLRVYQVDRCRNREIYQLKITRETELSTPRDTIDFGSIKANCIEQPYLEKIIPLCNNTAKAGQPRDLQVTGISNNMPQHFRVMNANLPITIPPNDCYSLVVRFYPGDTAAIYTDAITIISDDQCNTETKIDLKGTVEEVLGIYERDAETRLDSIDFGDVCVGLASTPVIYYWSNLSSEDISIDSIIYPEHFLGEINFERSNGYLRFLPQTSGNFVDSVILVAQSGDCTIHKKIIVKGVAYSADVSFEVQNIDFGNVVVGQDITLSASVRNNGDVALPLQFYLKRGIGYLITGNSLITIPPKQSRNVNITFRPSVDSIYPDELCLYLEKCFETICIPVTGRGVLQEFEYNPEVLNINDVLGCSDKTGKIYIKNRTQSSILLTNLLLDDPGNKFAMVSPLPSRLNLGPGDDFEFEIRYIPNDINGDRTDRAFIRYSSLSEEWLIQIVGRSVSPKLFVTEQTLFGNVEVGDTKTANVLIENISKFDIQVDEINLPAGFNRLFPDAAWPGQALSPGETINMIVEFAPQSEQNYSGDIEVVSSAPCLVTSNGRIEGKGLIVPLDVPVSILSYGFTLPCDCNMQQIQLINRSLTFDMEIENINIDDVATNLGGAHLFRWTSNYYEQNGYQLPYSIPPGERDTVKVFYCPDTPADRDSLEHDSEIYISARGNGWDRDFVTYLNGKRVLLFETREKLHEFPKTRVDTFSAPRYAFLTIPEPEVNPEQKRVKIDSIRFIPDERVFFAEDSLGRDSIYLHKGEELPLRLLFNPRSARDYQAKMAIYYSEPCNWVDTSVLVRGSGFAPAFGLNFNFDNTRKVPDTLAFINCDTLRVPVYTSRSLPAEIVDIFIRLGYDTTKLKYVGAESPYLDEACLGYTPGIINSLDDWGGMNFIFKNFCQVDSTRPFVIAKFVAKSMARDTFDISVDSISFDTEEVILFDILAKPDYGTIVVLEPEFEILNNPDFGPVRVLDCETQELRIKNTGDVKIIIKELLNLPPQFEAVSATPPLDTQLGVGDTIIIQIRYCPSKMETVLFDYEVRSPMPCPLIETSFMKGISYVPEFPVISDTDFNFLIVDTIFAEIGDLVQVACLLNRDIADSINSHKYWVNGLSFEAEMTYNPRALKYLETKPLIEGLDTLEYSLGSVNMKYSGVDTLYGGIFANIWFLATVPDSLESEIHLTARNFKTDSIEFIKIVPEGMYGILNLAGSCRLTTLEFSDNKFALYQNRPNPATGLTVIEFETVERSNVTLSVYSPEGREVIKLLDGSQYLAPGRYSVEFDATLLNSGVYTYVLHSGVNTEIRRMVISK